MYQLRSAIAPLALGAMGYVVAATLQGEPPADSEPPRLTEWEQQHVDDFADARVIDFSRDIRPLLAERCFLCHGPDASTRQANLRLDDRDHATALARDQSMPIIAPGEPGRSLLIQRVSSDDPDFRMPPDDHAALSAEQIEMLQAWIAQGAPYEQHWSLQPIENSAPPAVRDDGWPRDTLDSFILAALEARDLAPAPEADRTAWLRRVWFDLIGLPPSPQDVIAFESDRSPDAYEKAVDRLLASPHFGERWGRHWLDLMRYAETHGHEFDYPIRYAWRYRDYIIRALNADVRYDDLLREHIAGDLLSSPRLHPQEKFNESIIATGWWFLSQGTHGPVDVRADEAERIDNQIDVLSKTFLGLTVSCARCHDHKFDPISQRDYYALAGFIQSSRRVETFLDPRGEIAAAVERLRIEHGRAERAFASELPGAIRSLDRVRDHVLAAFEATAGASKADDGPVGQFDVTFADFEGDTYDGWAVEGTAFGDRPYTQETLAAYQGDVGARGIGFINSHNSRSGEDVRQADEHTGTMTSAPFTIEHDHIHFLIGGGAHAGRTCANLLVDGKVVRTATGRNSNRMNPATWDVRDLRGREAQIQIVDNERGGWGNIGVDHIVFSAHARPGPTLVRPLEQVASEFKLDPGQLARWILALDDPALEDALATASSADERGEPDAIFEGFDADWRSRWFIDGWGFDSGDPSITLPSRSINPKRIAHSGTLANGLQGAARSRTFTIEKPYIHYDLAGAGCRIRLIVDGYFLDEFNPLLFDGMTFAVDTGGEWRPHVQRIIDRYIGHRAYIEVLDEGDGWVAIDSIRFSDSPEVGPAAAASSTGNDDPQEIAIAIQDRAQQASERFERAAQTRSDAALLNWMLEHELVDRGWLQEQPRGEDPAIPQPLRVLALHDGNGEDELLFLRGNHRTPGERVHRRFIESIAGDDQPAIDSGSGRLALAERMLDPANPLPARVFVNRVWHHLFGVGIVETTDDFGALGKLPTHPELLDHLAHWIANEGEWSLKRLIRRIVLSSTYRMSSANPDPRAKEIDPGNTLLHEARSRRLEGEAIRDLLLSVSGRLDETMFGEPVAVHLTPFMTGRGRPGRSGPLDGDGRRSIYLEVRRNFLSPFMLTFDGPVPFSTVGRRSVSNVPAQPLILMNDPFVHEQAERWAKRVREDDSLATDRARIEHMILTAFSRTAQEQEVETTIAFLEDARQLHSEEGVEEQQFNARAWRDLAHALFNVKEFIYLR